MPSGLLIPASMQQGALKGGQLFDGSLVDDPVTELGPYADWNADNINLNDGDLIGTWPEIISGRDLLQSTTANKPEFDTGAPSFAKSVKFDGANDFMGAANHAPFTTSPLAYYAEFEIDTLPSVQGNQTLILQSNAALNNSSFGLFLDDAVPNDDKIGVFARDAEGDPPDFIYSDSKVSIGRYKVILRIDGSGVINLFINGVKQADTATLGSGSLWITDGPLYVGANVGPSFPFADWAKRTTHYDKAPTDAECIAVTA